MADIDTMLSFTWTPDLFPTPSFVDSSVGFDIGWPTRRGNTTYSGVVTWNGSPVEFKVVLMDLDSFSILDSTLSNPLTGEWTMPGWSTSYSQIAMCIDSSGTFQSIAFDRV